MERAIGDRRQALFLRERAEGQAHMAIPPQRILECREPAGEAIDALRRRPLVQEELLGLAFDETPDQTDAVTEVAGLRVAIDAQSRPYCDGAKIEWVDGPEGTGFLVRNPSMSGSCACSG